MKKITSILFVILTSCSTLHHNTHTSTKEECIDLLSVRILVSLPIPNRSYKENYEEGVIYVYTFKDGGYLLFMEGALMQIVVDTYTPEKIVTKNNIITSGRNQGKFWRKYVSGRVRIYYWNVDKPYKAKYDKLFKNIKILKRFYKNDVGDSAKNK